MKTGILLVNLGTPQAPTTKAVRTYLKEFLSDPRVLDIPKWLRWALLYGVILPFRPAKSAKAYQSIWDQRYGSPLMHYSQSLAKGLQAELGEDYLVDVAMRYGSPSIESIMSKMLDKITRLTIVPLYPQYASSTTGSVIEQCFEVLKERWNIPPIDIVEAFYDKAWYLQPLAEQTQKALDAFRPDHVLMSFHGLPVRQIEKSEEVVCAQDKPCPSVSVANYYCYRAQCYTTADQVMKRVSFKVDYTICFQSRLGRIPWIKPYTDEVLSQLRAQGVQRLSVACPSFVADCLETLEEIGIQLKKQWLELGGVDLQLIPALNAQPSWVQSLAQQLGHTQRQVALKRIA